MADRIITIGRQCGSGGHTIGRLLAQRLGLAFYDKEIVELTAAGSTSTASPWATSSATAPGSTGPTRPAAP